jgi:hypothetical protein
MNANKNGEEDAPRFFFSVQVAQVGASRCNLVQVRRMGRYRSAGELEPPYVGCYGSWGESCGHLPRAWGDYSGRQSSLDHNTECNVGVNGKARGEGMRAGLIDPFNANILEHFVRLVGEGTRLACESRKEFPSEVVQHLLVEGVN